MLLFGEDMQCSASDKSVLDSLDLAQPPPLPSILTGCDVNGRVDKSLTVPGASSHCPRRTCPWPSCHLSRGAERALRLLCAGASQGPQSTLPLDYRLDTYRLQHLGAYLT